MNIAEANAGCLIETNQIQAAPAQYIANRFLISKGVSDADGEEVQSAPGYDDLVLCYINKQGGCEDLVRKGCANAAFAPSLRSAYLCCAACPAVTGWIPWPGGCCRPPGSCRPHPGRRQLSLHR